MRPQRGGVSPALATIWPAAKFHRRGRGRPNHILVGRHLVGRSRAADCDRRVAIPIVKRGRVTTLETAGRALKAEAVVRDTSKVCSARGARPFQSRIARTNPMACGPPPMVAEARSFRGDQNARSCHRRFCVFASRGCRCTLLIRPIRGTRDGLNREHCVRIDDRSEAGIEANWYIGGMAINCVQPIDECILATPVVNTSGVNVLAKVGIVSANGVRIVVHEIGQAVIKWARYIHAYECTVDGRRRRQRWRKRRRAGRRRWWWQHRRG